MVLALVCIERGGKLRWSPGQQKTLVTPLHTREQGQGCRHYDMRVGLIKKRDADIVLYRERFGTGIQTLSHTVNEKTTTENELYF